MEALPKAAKYGYFAVAAIVGVAAATAAYYYLSSGDSKQEPEISEPEQEQEPGIDEKSSLIPEED